MAYFQQKNFISEAIHIILRLTVVGMFDYITNATINTKGLDLSMKTTE